MDIDIPLIEIILALCLIFGVDKAIHNLRSYITGWSSVSIPSNSTLLVHRGDWEEQTVKLQVSTRQDALSLEIPGDPNILNNT